MLSLTGNSSQVPPGFSLPERPASASATISKPNGVQQGNQQFSAVQSAAPNYNLLNSPLSAGPSGGANQAQSSMYLQQSIEASRVVASQQPIKPSDPFASIASSARASPRPQPSSAPVSSQTPVSTARYPPQQNSLVDLGNPLLPSSDSSKIDTSTGDDDWDFSGAPPPEEEEFTVFNEDVKIEFQVSRASMTTLNIIVVFSNNTPQPISKLEFLSGMPKVSHA